MKNCNPERKCTSSLSQNVNYNSDKNVTHYFSALQQACSRMLISKFKKPWLLLCSGNNITAVLRSTISYFSRMFETCMQANHAAYIVRHKCTCSKSAHLQLSWEIDWILHKPNNNVRWNLIIKKWLRINYEFVTLYLVTCNL